MPLMNNDSVTRHLECRCDVDSPLNDMQYDGTENSALQNHIDKVFNVHSIFAVAITMTANQWYL